MLWKLMFLPQTQTPFIPFGPPLPLAIDPYPEEQKKPRALTLSNPIEACCGVLGCSCFDWAPLSLKKYAKIGSPV